MARGAISSAGREPGPPVPSAGPRGLRASPRSPGREAAVGRLLGPGPPAGLAEAAAARVALCCRLASVPAPSPPRSAGPPGPPVFLAGPPRGLRASAGFPAPYCSSWLSPSELKGETLSPGLEGRGSTCHFRSFLLNGTLSVHHPVMRSVSPATLAGLYGCGLPKFWERGKQASES